MKLDRLGSSLRDLLDIAEMLGERGVSLRSVTDHIDTATAASRMLYAVLGAVAQFERDVLRERTVAGMWAANSRGEHMGRPPVLTSAQVGEAKNMLARAEIPNHVARILRVRRSTLYRAIRKHEALIRFFFKLAGAHVIRQCERANRCLSHARSQMLKTVSFPFTLILGYPMMIRGYILSIIFWSNVMQEDIVEHVADKLWREVYEMPFRGKSRGRFAITREQLKTALEVQNLHRKTVRRLQDAALKKGLVIIDLDDVFPCVETKVIREYRRPSKTIFESIFATASQGTDPLIDDEEPDEES